MKQQKLPSSRLRAVVVGFERMRTDQSSSGNRPAFCLLCRHVVRSHSASQALHRSCRGSEAQLRKESGCAITPGPKHPLMFDADSALDKGPPSDATLSKRLGDHGHHRYR